MNVIFSLFPRLTKMFCVVLTFLIIDTKLFCDTFNSYICFCDIFNSYMCFCDVLTVILFHK